MTINQLLRELEWSGSTHEDPACPRCGAPGPGVLWRRYRDNNGKLVEEYGGVHDEPCDLNNLLRALERYDG